MAAEANVLVMHFDDSSKAFEALSEVKAQPGVASAAVVERTADDQVRVADSYTPSSGGGTAVGGLVGALVGILAGPLGVLLGWSAGTLSGAVYDIADAADTDDGLTVLSRSIPAGGNVLIVEMAETSHAIGDDIAKKLGGTVTRIPATEVTAEVEAAQDAARAAAAAARQARRQQRRGEFKQRLSGIVHHTKTS